MLRRLMPVICLVLPFLLAATSTPLMAAPGDVKTSFKAPGRYPSGLASDGKHLFVADWRDAQIFKLNPEDGSVLATLSAPTLKPHGLACSDGKLYISDDHTGGVYVLDIQSKVVERTFKAPHARASGLAYADGVLFILAGEKVYRVLPDDGTILGYFETPAPRCQCMTHDGKYLWISNRTKDELYMVEPDDGKVLGILKAPGPYPVGVAWLDGHLWNADFQTRQLYQLVVRDDPMYSLSKTRRARVEYLWTLTNYGPGEVRDLTLNVAVPMELPNQKVSTFHCLDSSTSDEGIPFTRKEVRDQWGQACKQWKAGRVAAGVKVMVSYAVEVEVSAIRYLIIPEKVGSLKDIPPDIRERYTADASRYRINTPYMRETVRKVVGDEQNAYWIARKIYDFVIDSLEYEMVGGWDVPQVVLKRGSGSCSEYTYTFVALCRAAGVPAGYQGSIVVRGDDACIDEAFHRWAIIYLPNYGWIPVDANRGDAKSLADQARGFGGLSNRFLITTQGGGDSEHLAWSYNSFAKYAMIGFCKVEEDSFGLWEPLDPTTQSAQQGEGGAARAGP